MSKIVPLLRTQGLTMRFGGVTAVKNVDFTVGEVELRCLIGPNGAGKSTFFKMLTGQLTPSLGTIEFRGIPTVGAASHTIARLGIGIKTQVSNVFNGLSVRENIWLAARRRSTPLRAKLLVEELLEKVRLAHRAMDLVGELSHGQRQWVEIGMVLAAEPQLLLLDEPAAGMTDEETVRTAELLREINLTRALIVVEHDMQFIRMIAKGVTVFHRGEILMEDTIDAVMRDPRVRDVYLGKRVAA